MHAIKEITWDSDGLMNGLLNGIGGRVFLGERIHVDNRWYDDYVLMQYTGLHDKKGKEIYDGDLIKGDGYGPYPVFWDKDHSGFCSCCYSDAEPISRYKTIEVVGNIYENPEILETDLETD